MTLEMIERKGVRLFAFEEVGAVETFTAISCCCCFNMYVLSVQLVLAGRQADDSNCYCKVQFDSVK